MIFKSSDDQLFKFNEAVAIQSEHIKNIVEDVGTANAFPILKISGKIHSKVVETRIQELPPTKLRLGMRNSLKLIRPLLWLRSVSVFDFIMVPI